MREKKFKVWDNVDFMSAPFTLQDLQERKVQFTKDCIELEFTGLLCHGNEVYEGDLLQRDSSAGKGTVIGEVYFDEGQFRIKWYPKEKGWNNSLYIHLDDCEYIGSKFQNPELLDNL